MIRAGVLAALAAFAAGPVLAQAPLDGAAFQALTEGKTLHFNRWGQPYGAEQYLPGRVVIWRFEGEDCLRGRWYTDGEAICFLYEDLPEPVCWTVLEGPDGMHVREINDVPGNDLTVRKETAIPLSCPGEFLGS